MKRRSPLPVEHELDDDHDIDSNDGDDHPSDIAYQLWLENAVEWVENDLNYVAEMIELYPQMKDTLLGVIRDFLSEYDPPAQQSLFA